MTSPMTIEQADALAVQAAQIVKSRMTDAVRYAEAYGHAGRTLVIDGSQYSPSTRAVPYAEQVWAAAEDDAELWWRFEDALDCACSDMTVQEDTDSEAPGDWYLEWDEGCLFACSPDWAGDVA